MFKIDIMQFQLLIKDTLNEDYFSHCIKLWSGINRWWSANKTIPNRITTTDIYKAMIYNLKIIKRQDKSIGIYYNIHNFDWEIIREMEDLS
jgi:hypothetical protein